MNNQDLADKIRELIPEYEPKKETKISRDTGKSNKKDNLEKSLVVGGFGGYFVGAMLSGLIRIVLRGDTDLQVEDLAYAIPIILVSTAIGVYLGYYKGK